MSHDWSILTIVTRRDRIVGSGSRVNAALALSSLRCKTITRGRQIKTPARSGKDQRRTDVVQRQQVELSIKPWQGQRTTNGREEYCRSFCRVGAQDSYATTALAFVHKAHAAINIFRSKMTCQTQIDRQRLFLKYRELFVGRNACVRKRRVVRKLVSDQPPVPGDSVGDSHIDRIVPSLISLLKCRVFESEEEARKHFPDLFSEPPQEPSAKNISKKRKASSGRSIEEKYAGVRIASSRETGSACLVLHHPRIPFQIQHRVLSVAQQILEESCFNFIRAWLPSLLEERGWRCGTAVELTKWLYVIKKHMKSLPDNCMSIAERASFNKLVPIVAQLRHAAVHRLHLLSNKFLSQIHSASVLAEALQEEMSKASLQTMYAQVDTHVKKMNQDVEAMNQEGRKRIIQIQAEREKLRQEELLLRQSMAQQLIDISAATGQALTESIATSFAPGMPGAVRSSENMATEDERATNDDFHVTINDTDIESDEDQLQAEL
uniref:Similar to ubiquinol-cytochrome-c reductase n=1 Tax=Alternaria alternata TaxID=5599 RepID=C9K7B2_ALTAL|nr:similar to ubiquinol-cytochrome-c reductase [Alternaria alternata]